MEPVWAYRCGVASRFLAAAGGGYAIATLFSIFLARVLPVSPAAALMAAMLTSFAIYAASVIWAFAASTATRAWLGIAASAAVLASVAWLLGQGALA